MLTDWIPLLRDLRQYHPEWLSHDVIAGLSVAAVQVPTAIAYANLAGFPPEVGLYASMLPVLIYALFGSSRQLIIGPDAATCAMIAALLLPLAHGDLAHYLQLSATLAIMAGLLMLIGGMTRMGFIVNFFARPILVGFLNGVALSIIAGQLGKLVGITGVNRDFAPSLLELAERLGETHGLSLTTGLSTLLLTDSRQALRAAGAGDVDFAIEVVPEVPTIKREVLSQLGDLCAPETVIASNTSALDIFSIADVKGPERLIISHFFAPAHINPLVEVVPGLRTSAQTVSFTAALLERVGKRPVVMKKYWPGFIGNRIQKAIGETVLQMIEEGVATPEEIDRAMKLTLGIRLPVVGVAQTLIFKGSICC